jgi:hypothetical protein
MILRCKEVYRLTEDSREKPWRVEAPPTEIVEKYKSTLDLVFETIETKVIFTSDLDCLRNHAEVMDDDDDGEELTEEDQDVMDEMVGFLEKQTGEKIGDIELEDVRKIEYARYDTVPMVEAFKKRFNVDIESRIDEPFATFLPWFHSIINQ